MLETTGFFSGECSSSSVRDSSQISCFVSFLEVFHVYIVMLNCCVAAFGDFLSFSKVKALFVSLKWRTVSNCRIITMGTINFRLSQSSFTLLQSSVRQSISFLQVLFADSTTVSSQMFYISKLVRLVLKIIMVNRIRPILSSIFLFIIRCYLWLLYASS